MPLKEAKIRDESELESILIKNPEQIEEDFKIITHQRKAYGQDRIDILGLDSQGILTIIELKVIQDINQLRQALNYYDWVVERGLYWISDAYKHKLESTSLAKRLPQIFLVAPDFDEKMIREAKYIRDDIKIRLFRYLVFEIEGNKEVKLVEVSVPKLSALESEPMTIDDNINYIDDEAVRKIFKLTMQKIKAIDEKNIQQKEGNWVITYWISGLKFCELYPRKQYFGIGFKTDENEQRWDSINNLPKDQIDDIINEKITKAYKLTAFGGTFLTTLPIFAIITNSYTIKLMKESRR